MNVMCAVIGACLAHRRVTNTHVLTSTHAVLRLDAALSKEIVNPGKILSRHATGTRVGVPRLALICLIAPVDR
jgi:hypothetical protein